MKSGYNQHHTTNITYMRLFEILSCFTLLILIGCNSNHIENVNQYKSDTVVIIHRDTIFVLPPSIKHNAQEKGKDIDTIKQAQQKKSPLTTLPKKQPIKLQASSTDTTFYYYTNKSVSVKVTPWVNNERWTLLYDLKGNETYRQKDERKSYSIFSQLSFHPNGAVTKMLISTNPGASMYWYETTITFSTTNDPEQKTDERKPYDNLQIEKPWEYWDSKTKQWKKQQVMD